MDHLKYPHVRQELIDSLIEFADPAFQRNVWLDPSRFENLAEALPYVDVLWGPDNIGASGRVGEVLRDSAEAGAADAFAASFRQINELLGPHADDKCYLNHPLWTAVVSSAQALLSLLLANDERQPDGAS